MIMQWTSPELVEQHKHSSKPKDYKLILFMIVAASIPIYSKHRYLQYSAPSNTLTRLNLCSVLVQASMKVCAITDKEASTTSWTWTSKMKWGFFKMFTQNLSGKLWRRQRNRQPSYLKEQRLSRKLNSKNSSFSLGRMLHNWALFLSATSTRAF